MEDELRNILDTYPHNELIGLVKQINNKTRKEINKEIAYLTQQLRSERLIKLKNKRTKNRLIDEILKFDLSKHKIEKYHYTNFID
jgi:hypothetical protein